MTYEAIPANPTLFDLLQMRYEFEELNRHFKNMPSDGSYETMKRFITNGYSRNRTRPGADRALQLATVLVRHVDTTESACAA